MYMYDCVLVRIFSLFPSSLLPPSLFPLSLPPSSLLSLSLSLRLTGAASATVEDLKTQTSAGFQNALKSKKVVQNVIHF